MLYLFASDREFAVGHGGAFIKFRRDQMHHHAGLCGFALDKLPDHLLPGAFGAAGGSRM